MHCPGGIELLRVQAVNCIESLSLKVAIKERQKMAFWIVAEIDSLFILVFVIQLS